MSWPEEPTRRAGQRSRPDEQRSAARRNRVNADRQLTTVVRAYRALAYVTGTVLIVLCFVGIPLQVWANNLVIVRYVGTAHGMLYIAYVIVAFVMTRMVRMRVASPGTVIVLLAGTIPVLTFR